MSALGRKQTSGSSRIHAPDERADERVEGFGLLEVGEVAGALDRLVTREAKRGIAGAGCSQIRGARLHDATALKQAAQGRFSHISPVGRVKRRPTHWR